ncbi:fimbrial protein [Scandinavium sp. H11S7]|uniref:fimbrial protein n=1 Tax=Scandinavium hiltneri TaxID=2926519 RepID=UPI00216524B9|nr:fimbrial protein [Scandinavium hiltneri]MCS2155954.1 fimbrial protein [Scandinavium hiltneri]
MKLYNYLFFFIASSVFSSSVSADINQINAQLNITYTLHAGTCQFNTDTLQFSFGSFTKEELIAGRGIEIGKELIVDDCSDSFRQITGLRITDAGGVEIKTIDGIPQTPGGAKGVLLQLYMKNTSNTELYFPMNAFPIAPTAGTHYTLYARLSAPDSSILSAGQVNAVAWLNIDYF